MRTLWLYIRCRRINLAMGASGLTPKAFNRSPESDELWPQLKHP